MVSEVDFAPPRCRNLKTWLSKFAQRSASAVVRPAADIQAYEDVDPISLYLKNRVIIPLHLKHFHADFPATNNRRRFQMESRAQGECNWTEQGVVDGFQLATAHFPRRNWSIYYQWEEESQSMIRNKWYQEHPEYRRYAEGRMPDIMEENDSLEASACALTGTFHLNSTPLSICYNEQILYRFMVQRYLKEMTDLPCIPEIHATQAWVGSGPEVRNGMGQHYPVEELSWLVKDSVKGVKVKVSHDPEGKGTDKIYYRGTKNNWIRLSGREKERFLDDLARIQVAYSFITFPHIGTLSLRQCRLDEDTSIPALQLDDRVGTVTVDIESTISAKDYLTSAGIDTDPLPSPYPLQPILPIWENLLINPESGNIVLLRNSSLARTVPWEVAAQSPLKLSRRSHEKYIHSLKRHWFGYYVRIRQDEGRQISLPRLDQLISQRE